MPQSRRQSSASQPLTTTLTMDVPQSTLAGDVHALSTILHYIRPQLTSPITVHDDEPSRSSKSTAKLYSHIATVLTTGRDGTDRTGGATNGISVTGAASKTYGVSIAVSFDDCSDSFQAGAQNPPTRNAGIPASLTTVPISVSNPHRAAREIAAQ